MDDKATAPQPVPTPSFGPKPGPSVATPPPGLPTRPPAPAPAPQPAPAPSMPKSAPVPAPTPVTPQASGPKEYKTSIRTMTDDISKLKVGQQPSGVSGQKSINPTLPTAPVPPPAPTSRPTLQAPQLELGKVEKSRPLPGMPTPPTPSAGPKSVVAPQINIPSSGPKNSSTGRFLAIILVGALLAGGAYWLLGTSEDPEVVVSPTPIPTQSPTPKPSKSLAELFPGTEEIIELPASGNVTALLQTRLTGMTLPVSTYKKLAIMNPAKGSIALSTIGLLDRLLISYPLTLASGLGNESLILAYGQQEQFDAKGKLSITPSNLKKLVLIIEATDPIATNQALTSWEPTMADALPTLLDYQKAKAASKDFTTNTSLGTIIRYKNFPYADRTIDYALVSAANNKTYWVLTGSREAMFNTIKKLKETSESTPTPSVSPSPSPSQIP